MILRNILVTLCFISFFANASVVVAPTELTLKQPNGFTFKAKAKGNIHHDWLETLDGKRIQQVNQRWFYLYLDKQNIAYVSSAAVGSLSAKALLKVPNSQQFPRVKSLAKLEASKTQQKTDTLRLPSGEILTSEGRPTLQTNGAVTSHNQNVLVLLVSFNNQDFVYDAPSFQSLIFGDGGVSGYYNTNSYGNFQISPAAENHSTANDGMVEISLALNHPNSKFGSDTVVKAAFAAADAFVDYAAFDSNSDGTLSAQELSIVMIAAGYEMSFTGEVGALTPSVWGHKATVDAVTHDGVSLSPYTMFGERHARVVGTEHQATMGIMAHELGHLMLDLPDLYDTDDNVTTVGIGDWGLMGGGSWSNLSGEFSGSKPSGMMAWSKKHSGFAEPTVISSGQTLLLESATTSAAFGQIWIDNYQLNEYFLLENRRQNGVDAALPGQGLLISHIDQSETTNANEAHRVVDIEAADNTMSEGDDGDTYPGTTGVTEFTSSTTPSSANHAGQSTGVAVTDISESSNLITLGHITPMTITGNNLSYNEGRNTGFHVGFSSGTLWSALNVQNTTTLEQIDGFEVFLTSAATVTFHLYDTITAGRLGDLLHTQSNFSGIQGWNRFMLTTPQSFTANSSVVMVLNIVADNGFHRASVNNNDSTPSGRSYVASNQGNTFSEISSSFGDLNQHLLISGQVNTNLDTDGDGIIDTLDNCPTVSNADQLNTDEADDGGDACDSDDDNDGVIDTEDAFPLDANETLDTDNDGTGNNADTDDDNDGVIDADDAFPLDATETLDTDNDGTGNNADTDDDNDGVADSDDAFPLDSNETLDTDNDGTGNNADTDDDNDRMPDTWEVSHSLNALDAADAALDADGDGFSNLQEYTSGTDPNDSTSVPQTDGALKWRYQTEGTIYSSPAVADDGTVYNGSADGYLYALNADGSLKWRYQTDGGINASPSIGADGSIYIGSWDNYFYALNSDGTLKWRYQTDDNIFASAAIADDGTLYVGSWDDYLYAFNSDGSLKWRYLTGGNIWSSAAIATDGTVYIGSADGDIYALNSNGTLKWRYSTGGAVLSSATIGADGAVYLGSVDRYLYAIQSDGSLKWRYRTNGVIYASVAIAADNTLYVGSQDNNLYALTASGSLKWRYLSGDDIRSVAALGADGTIYVGSADNDLYALNANGSLKWRYQSGGKVFASPALGADGTLYISSQDSYIYALNTLSEGLADSVWPMFGHDARHSGQSNLTGIDTDGDGIPDNFDNCPTVSNNDQLNTDDTNDGGDACDSDDDNDGTPDSDDAFPLDPSETLDTDNDGIGNNTDTDDDGDGMPDSWEGSHGLNSLDSGDASLDADGDGFSNLQEYISSTDPNDSTSIPGGDGVLKWQYQTDGGVYASPAIGDDGTIYVGSADDYFYALNIDGSQKWRYQTGGNINGTASIDSDGTVYVGSSDNYLYALNADGSLKWRYLTGRSIIATATFGEDGTIYVGSWDNYLYAINVDGSLKWRYLTDGAVWSSPSIDADGTLYIGSMDGYLYALNADGSLKWRYQTGGGVVSSVGIAGNGNVYVGSLDNHLYALDTSGTLLWRYRTGSNIYSSPVIAADGTIYIGSLDNSLYAINTDGSVKWRYRSGGDIRSVAALGADGTVYVGSGDNYLYAVNHDGSLRWRYLAGGAIFSSPVIGSDGTVYIGSQDSNIYALSTNNGGLANSSWPMFVQNARHGGRLVSLGSDSDGDGFIDEFDNCPNISNSNQLNTDGASDGGDVCDSDDDNDGVADSDDAFPLDASETLDTDNDGTGNNTDSDDDGDEMSDSWEISHGLNSLDAADASVDTDGDGFSNLQEFIAQTDPNDSTSTPGGDGVLKWQYQTEGLIYSSPAIATDGTVYVGSADDHLYAFNADGSLKWRYQSGGNVFSSASVAADGTVYFGSFDGYLYALNSDGSLKWRYQTGDRIFSSPTIAVDGTIYVGSWDDNLYALNTDGSLKWRYQTGGDIWSSPTVAADGTIYIGSVDTHIYALTSGGQLRWRYKTGRAVLSNMAIGADGSLYAGSADGYLYGLNIDGTLQWRFATASVIYSSATVAVDGTIYIGALDDYVYAVNPDGSFKWRFQTGGDIRSVPAVGADGTVYVGSADSHLYAFNADGSQKWRYASGGPVLSSPAIASDGSVYIGSWDKTLYVLTSDSGGLADSVWPMFGQNSQHTGLSTVTDSGSFNRIDFESGDFTQADFVLSDNANWTVTTTQAAGGTHSAQSSESLGHNQNATLTLTTDTGEGNISFSYAVSSEAVFDVLSFAIDGEVQEIWSGEVDWSMVSFAVSAGSHEFEWIYSKDGSSSEGADSAWIDDILIPKGQSTPAKQTGFVTEQSDLTHMANDPELLEILWIKPD